MSLRLGEIGDRHFSLKEIQEVRGSWGLPIERDLYFEPKTMRELMERDKDLKGNE